MRRRDNVRLEAVLDQDYFKAAEAVESMSLEGYKPEDFALLVEVHLKVKNILFKIEIMERIAHIDSPEVNVFLFEQLHSQRDSLTRYIAASLLIYRKVPFDQIAPTNRSSSFWKSLELYSRFLAGEVSVEELHKVATESIRSPRNWWRWLTNKEEADRSYFFN